MQTDPWEINMTGLITGGAIRGVYLPYCGRAQVKENQRITAGLIRLWFVWCFCVWQQENKNRGLIKMEERLQLRPRAILCRAGGSGQPIWGPLGQIPNTNTAKERQKARGGRW